ncbi:unnamed protein product, partial [Lactuca virosa]
MADPSPDVKESFGKYSDDGIHMSFDQLLLFIEEFQGSDGASISIYLIDSRENIYKFAKKGFPLSQIGVILRDSHGIVQVNSITGSKILGILKANGKHYHSHNLIAILMYWDLRQQNPVHTQQLPDRCYGLTVRHPLMVVATGDRNLIAFNLQNPL